MAPNSTKNAEFGTSAKIVNGSEVNKSTNIAAKEVMRVFSRKFKIETGSAELNVADDIKRGIYENVFSPLVKEPKKEHEHAIANEYAQAIKLASRLPKKTRFEIFNELHNKSAAHLINIFYRVPSNELKEVLEYARTRVNHQLLQYAYSVALLHRHDLDVHIQIPSHASTQPNMYFDMNEITDNLKNKKFIRIEGDKKHKILVEISENFTATNQDPEHKVAYFREDIGYNLHHRHWHEVYPFEGPDDIVMKDRRGELFYYMHQQIIARYHFERRSNLLPAVEPYKDFEEPVKEAYFPKLELLSKYSDFSSRPANIMLKDLNRDGYIVTLTTMERWMDRIYDSIDRGYAYTIDRATNQEVLKKIDQVTGIDELGNTIEASGVLSWNPQYYGNLHNRGHTLFGYAHDPDNRFKESSGVMSYPETAARDPIFYRWHKHMDDIFQYYKRTLPPYTVQQKQFVGINIHSVKILPESEKIEKVRCRNGDSVHVRNVLKTFWEKDAVDITEGIVVASQPEPKERIFAVFTHLQHEQFKYEIKVSNNLSDARIVTIRIFISPHQNEAGMPMPFNEQRRLFMEMDKFTAKLNPQTITTIKRKSTESSVTIPFHKTFMSYKDAKKIVKDPESNQQSGQASNSYCSCGWPQHLLIGKGTPGKGLLCDLFVMITNYEDDKVEESPLIQTCCQKSSISYCGVRNKKYPDRKPMGFPFDRDISSVTDTIEDFMTEQREDDDKNTPNRFSNMMMVPVLVRHLEGLPRRGQSLRDLGCTDAIFKKLTYYD